MSAAAVPSRLSPLHITRPCNESILCFRSRKARPPPSLGRGPAAPSEIRGHLPVFGDRTPARPPRQEQ
eukprot:7476463-Pyramimonas_sp.AAC.1